MDGGFAGGGGVVAAVSVAGGGDAGVPLPPEDPDPFVPTNSAELSTDGSPFGVVAGGAGVERSITPFTFRSGGHPATVLGDL